MITQIRKMTLQNFAAVLCLLMALSVISQAQEKKEKVQKVAEIKELSGRVIAFTPKTNPELIGLAVDEEDTDYYFILDKDVKVVHKNSLSQLLPGDTVRVKYYVVVEETESGEEKRKHVAKVITFVKPNIEGMELKGLKSK